MENEKYYCVKESVLRRLLRNEAKLTTIEKNIYDTHSWYLNEFIDVQIKNFQEIKKENVDGNN